MKLSVCVIFQEGDDLQSWKNSLPDMNIEIVALKTSENKSLAQPKFTELGKTSDHILLQWEYPDFEEYFDFSYCRNKLDDYATGDWILHMDSDERLASPKDEFIEYLEELNISDADAAALSIAGVQNQTDDNYSYLRKRYCLPSNRLYRRSACLKWHAICHETVKLDDKERTVADTDILLYHKGYSLSTKDLIKKAERNGKLMIREYTREKSERNWNYLINTFYYLKQLHMR